MPDHPWVVEVGDRLLLDPSVTGLPELSWAEVEVVALVDDPTPLPWNAGAEFPYRVGYRIGGEAANDTAAVAVPRRGIVWLSVHGHDPAVGVRRIERTTPPRA